MNPPRRGDRIMDWLIMLLCVSVASPALMVNLKWPDAADPHEARAVTTSIETFERLATLEDDATFAVSQLQPYLNNRRQLEQPPGLTWAHLTIFALSPWPISEASTEGLVLLARVASVLMGLLIVAAVYWAGHSVGGRTTAVLAALVCAANPVFLWHARLATADIHFTAWALLSIAAALWAVRPLRPQPSVERQFIGWVVAGVALGLAILTHGAWALPKVVLPVIIIIILCPGRMGHLLGLVAALLIGVLMALPWAVYAHIAQELSPHAWFLPTSAGAELGWRTTLIVLGILPWTLWIVVALLQPFSASSSGARLRLAIGWSWFVTATALFFVTSPIPTRAADLLPVLPAAAIVLGQQFNQYSSLADEGRYPRLWRLFRWPHFVVFAAASVVLPGLLALQPLPYQNQYTYQPGWWFWLGLSVALLGLVMLSTRWALKNFPAKALACWAVWMLVLLGTVAIPLSRGPVLKNQILSEIRDKPALGVLTEEQPLYWLTSSEAEADPVNPSLLLFARRPIPQIGQDQIDQLLREHEQLYLLRPDRFDADPNSELMEDMPLIERKLWLYTQSTAATFGGDNGSTSQH